MLKLLESTYHTRMGRGYNIYMCDKCGYCKEFRSDFKKTETKCICEELAKHHKRLYSIYRNIRNRCNVKTNPRYKDYGGRGIKCEWKTFEDFFQDMQEDYYNHTRQFGEKQTTIDRINNDRNYCKQNCDWKTHTEQQMNSRSTHVINIDGEIGSLTYFARKFGLNPKNVNQRVNKLGWSYKKALGL